MLHKIQNEIKANAKSVYSNLGGGAHEHLGLVLTDVQYVLIENTPFIYPTHLGPLIIIYGKTSLMNSNTQISHTEEVHIFREVTGVEQYPVQQIDATSKEEHLTDIRNQMMNYINNAVADVLTHLQEKCGQLIPHELLESKAIAKKTMYYPRYLIATTIFAIEELLDFANITGTSYTQNQAVNIAYAIIHRTIEFGLEICKWNQMPTVQNTWIGSKQFFWMAHHELREKKTSPYMMRECTMRKWCTVW